jgi:hypothetical protein
VCLQEPPGRGRATLSSTLSQILPARNKSRGRVKQWILGLFRIWPCCEASRIGDDLLLACLYLFCKSTLLDKTGGCTYSQFPLSYTSKGLSLFFSTDRSPSLPSPSADPLPRPLPPPHPPNPSSAPSARSFILLFSAQYSHDSVTTSRDGLRAVHRRRYRGQSQLVSCSIFTPANTKILGFRAIAGNDEIESQLKKDRIMAKNEIKMLLLGAGESGKARIFPGLPLKQCIDPSPQSTVLKQMKLIHHGGYNDQERESYKEIIYSNTIQSMRCEILSHRVFRPPCSFYHPGQFSRHFPTSPSNFLLRMTPAARSSFLFQVK